MKKYLYYSTILSIFSEAFVFRYGFDLKLFYFFVLSNLLIIAIISRLFINKYLIFFYVFLLTNGILTIVLGTNTVPLFLSQFLGITIVSFYFFNFFVIFKDKVTDIFRDYSYISYYLAIVGIIIFVINLISGQIMPLKSLMLEPAHYATIVLPAFYYTLKNKAFPRTMWRVILISIFLSGSSLGILGIGLAIILIPKRIKFYKLAGSLVVAAIFFTVVYFNYAMLRVRVDDTLNVIKERDLTGVNLSTYLLASNFIVAMQSLEANPMLGSGLGSHELSHEKYINSIKGIEGFKEFIEINAKDAASLFTRILSDLGVPGLTIVAVFFIFNYVNSNHEGFYLISRAILIYLFCKFFREGHYFPPEFYFFIFAFIFTRKAARKNAREINAEKDQIIVTNNH